MLTKYYKTYEAHVQQIQEHNFLAIKQKQCQTTWGVGAGRYEGMGGGQESQIHPPGEAWEKSNLPPRQVKGSSYYGM